MALPDFTTQDNTTYKTNIDASIDDHETRVGDNETELADHETRIGDLEALPVAPVIYHGRVAHPTTMYGSSGFTVTNPATGRYRINHGLGIGVEAYSFIASMYGNLKYVISATPFDTNNIDVYINTTTTQVGAAGSFYFSLIVY